MSIVFIDGVVTGSDGASGECRDLHDRVITPGLHYVPGPDTCTLCVCDNGQPKWCKAVLCSPPQDCKSFRVGNSCCEFICLDDTILNRDGGHDINADLGLRLIASAITAILSLSLLFFLIHRLRQRKIRGRQSRQLSEDSRSLGSIGYIAGSLGYLPPTLGCQDYHYEEAGSHFPLWKPPGNYFPRGEAPPPYEEAVAAARAEAALAARTTPGPSLSVHSHLHHQHRTIPLTLATSGPLSPPPPEARLATIRPDLFFQEVVRDPAAPPTTDSLPSRVGPLEAQCVRPSVHTTLPTVMEDDDYRSECENCNMAEQGGEFDTEMETMTLHRRPHEETADPFPPYRTSLTLPTNCRRQRSTPMGTPAQSGARENWFSSMPSSTSSSEEE
ncbi:integral membrane protein DGCR2/IDD-like [Homalodisca vitripennis]|uniref:integral membrane protein DGCR2/IDD-like n=1 Tax=Homalodisca vitripennis TaxID=197043 RepID=UPI001EEC0197|nr:integral membrane protein DGCR2/IDD-like [Homalodisca vitripennis]